MRGTYVALVSAILLGSSSRASEAAANHVRPCPGLPAQGQSIQTLGSETPRRILNESFADPFIAKFGSSYHAYATEVQIGARHINVQRRRSRNLIDWSPPAEALPNQKLPAWIDPAHPQVWAPEVMKIAGRYVMYFNARHHELTRTEREGEAVNVRKRHCVGAAVSCSPAGPFAGVKDPLVCSEFPDGVIDASPFRDGNELYLYYKDDGNCCGRGSALYVQRLKPDGLSVNGPAEKLLANDDSEGDQDKWEWRVVEAPTMVKRAGSYYLFYSGNFYGNKNYSVGYLRCSTPRGPCTDLGENPLLWSHDQSPLIGPGHQTLIEKDGRSYIFFHGWNLNPDGEEVPGVHKRCLYAGRVDWERSPQGDERPRIPGGKPPPR